MVFARNAAMSFNRYIDKEFDKKNPRTAIRELPQGILSSFNVLVFCIVNCILFVITTYFINMLCFWLSFVALFVVLFYSYTKRFTSLSHIVLGIGLSLSPIGAYLVVTNHFALLPILFSFVVLFWVSGFDIIYSLQDEEFDRKEKLNSIPAKFGYYRSIIISRILHTITVILLLIIGFYGIFSILYWIGVFCFSTMLLYQHYIVQKYGLKKINLAFAVTNGIASLLFAVFVISDLILL
jgi:4-hydroxybenzoate polyprenyltransferase